METACSCSPETPTDACLAVALHWKASHAAIAIVVMRCPSSRLAFVAAISLRRSVARMGFLTTPLLLLCAGSVRRVACFGENVLGECYDLADFHVFLHLAQALLPVRFSHHSGIGSADNGIQTAQAECLCYQTLRFAHDQLHRRWVESVAGVRSCGQAESRATTSISARSVMVAPAGCAAGSVTTLPLGVTSIVHEDVPRLFAMDVESFSSRSRASFEVAQTTAMIFEAEIIGKAFGVAARNKQVVFADIVAQDGEMGLRWLVNTCEPTPRQMEALHDIVCAGDRYSRGSARRQATRSPTCCPSRSMISRSWPARTITPRPSRAGTTISLTVLIGMIDGYRELPSAARAAGAIALVEQSSLQ